MIPRDDATQAQVKAAKPHNSTWLSANAGSGKTRVLTDRVARLLLAQVPPERILCLTYTKAAAAEMQNRLFKRLGAWAMLDDAQLRDQLQQLGEEGPISDTALRKARTLFAAAIEAPGGLKIQTIHSFCSSVLRRFPLEAGVSPQFTEMEERAAELLQAEIVEDMAAGPQAALIRDLANLTGVADLSDLTKAVVQHRTKLSTQPDVNTVYAQFDLDPATDEDAVTSRVFLGSEQGILDALRPVLQASSTNDVKIFDKLARISTLDASSLPVLESAFLTLAGVSKAGKIPVKAAKSHFTEHQDALDQWIGRIEAARTMRIRLSGVEKTLALHRFASAFLARYEIAKQARGWLDFDDLILRTRDLLTLSDVAEWVLYRLDGGIDHILVDEAQDTSPAQWEVIERLTQEITAGMGARDDVSRTIFVVGDKKQSIYSFQGADPREFDRMREEFAAKLRPTDTPLMPAELQYSFRSAQCILELVDQCFEGHDTAGFGASATHIAFDGGPPGRVDIWPVIEKAEKDDADRHWTDTLDKPGAHDHNVLMAQRIANEIARMIETESIYDSGHNMGAGGFRPVRAGDVLILVQRRSDLFAEIIRACKSAGLPIAGADVLKVGAEMAVRDIHALLGFLATPEDDYALAVTLKSPLFGWDEDKLFDLAHGRDKQYLWQALRADPEKHPEVMSVLDDLLGQTDFLRPYDLIERVLTRHDGRRRFIGRLGREAEDGIDALLSQALAFERSRIPSLTGFLTWMETDDLTVKRQLGQDRDEVRVMTVHGSKGLEAPIVIMPETQKRQTPKSGSLLDMGDMVTWNIRNEDAPECVSTAKQTRIERQTEERMRLLYVAMTRAEKWLILGAAGDVGTAPDDSWYTQVHAAALKRPYVDHDFAFGRGLRIEPQPWEPADVRDTRSDHSETPILESYFRQPATPKTEVKTLLSPSTDLGGVKALPSAEALDEDAAKLRGTQVHTLLEHICDLDRGLWDSAARALLGEHLDDPAINALVAEAGAVIDAPHLGFLFAPSALAEVPVTADIPQLNGRRVLGILDRLIVMDDDVWIIDFKTNAGIPQTPALCPEGLLRQMGAYHAAITQLYPGKRVRAAIVWTQDTSLMELPEALILQALERSELPSMPA